jgi:hypothetical protein
MAVGPLLCLRSLEARPLRGCLPAFPRLGRRLGRKAFDVLIGFEGHLRLPAALPRRGGGVGVTLHRHCQAAPPCPQLGASQGAPIVLVEPRTLTRRPPCPLTPLPKQSRAACRVGRRSGWALAIIVPEDWLSPSLSFLPGCSFPKLSSALHVQP